MILSALVLFAALARGPAVHSDIQMIDLSRPLIKRSTMPLFSIGSDRTMIFLRDEHQRDLRALQSSIPFRYLRCHGLLNEEMKVVSRTADGSLVFDWTRVDQFIDRLRSVRLRPFMELSFMPEPLASGSHTVFWWNGNATPPRDPAEWRHLIDALTRHLIARYGAAEVHKWFFEVWNEPNLDYFWTGGKGGYFKLYGETVRAIKTVDSKLRVGGPSTAGAAWVPEFLDYCKANALPVDFVSTHTYSAKQGFVDSSGNGQTTLDTDPGSVVGDVARVRKQIDASPFPKLPFYITEWGPSYSPRDPVHDSYICAPFILQKLRECEGLVDGMSYWTFSDQFEEPGPPFTPFHGGFGLLNVDGVPKPAFLAYSFLAHLYDREVPVAASNLIVTRKGDQFRVLTWDYSPPADQDAPDDPFYHRDLPASALPDRVLTFSGLPPGRYRVSRSGIGYRRNDVYDAYLTLGKPQTSGAHLAPSVLKKLEAATAAEEESLPDLTVGGDGAGRLSLPMRTNDVWLVSIEKR